MERRIDPDDGEARTLQEMKGWYKGVYSDAEVEAYFYDECTPVQSAPTAAKSLTPAPRSAPPAANSGKIDGLEKWLEDRGLEEYLETVSKWCQDNGAISLQEVEDNFEDVKATILASEIDPGDRVRVTVLKGKWQGQYVAVVLETNSKGVTLRHEEDDFVETLPWSSLGGAKYSMEPVSDDEEDAAETTPSSLLRVGKLRVDVEAGAGLELRWVKVGYHVDSVERKPGQPDLHAGDAIVAIGPHILVGLDEDNVEARFGRAFANGVAMVIGPLNDLMKRPVEQVRSDAERLLATT